MQHPGMVIERMGGHASPGPIEVSGPSRPIEAWTDWVQIKVWTKVWTWVLTKAWELDGSMPHSHRQVRWARLPRLAIRSILFWLSSSCSTWEKAWTEV